MKQLRQMGFLIPLLVAICVPVSAQPGPSGRWRAKGTFPWEVSLKADGTLTGSVSSCSSVLGSFEIGEGTFDGRTLKFSCTSGDQRRRLSFVGIVSGDEIAFTWELSFLRGDPTFGRADDAMFGPTAPRQFSVQRIPDDPTGTWRAVGADGGILWEVNLRVDKSKLYGTVSSCSSNRGAIEIFDGRFDKGTVTFSCRALNRSRMLILTGKMVGNEIIFTWRKQAAEGDALRAADDELFGPSALVQFVARRVPEANLLSAQHSVQGLELAAAVNLIADDVKAEGKIFIPESVAHVRVVLVAIAWGVGFEVFNQPRWTELAKAINGGLLLVKLSNLRGSGMESTGARTTSEDGRDHALLALLRRLADESGHPELNKAPMLFWGHSFAAGIAATFADRFAERTVGFVRYQGGGQLSGDMKVVTRIPALFFDTAPIPSPLWEFGRSKGAPWTSVKEESVAHGELSEEGADLMVAWTRAITAQLISPDGKILRTIPDAPTWFGSYQSGEIAPYSSYSGAKAQASWLPDEASARAWQRVFMKR